MVRAPGPRKAEGSLPGFEPRPVEIFSILTFLNVAKSVFVNLFLNYLIDSLLKVSALNILPKASIINFIHIFHTEKHSFVRLSLLQQSDS